MIQDTDETRTIIKDFLAHQYDARPSELDLDAFFDFVNELPTFDECTVNTEANSFNL